MNKKSVFWGLAFILFAAYVVINKLGIMPAIPVMKIVFTVLLSAWALKGLFTLHFFEFFMPIAIIGCIFDSQLGIEAITPWTILFAAVLLSIGFDLIFKRFFPKKIREKTSYKFQLKFTDYKHIMNVPYLSGCFMFFRTSAFNTVGMFDERFFMYLEDCDIARRVSENYKALFYPMATVYHLWERESKRNKKLLLIHVMSIIKYFLKWGIRF